MQGQRRGRGELKFPVIVWRIEGIFTLRSSCFVQNNAVLSILDGRPLCRAGRVGEEKKSVPVRNPNRGVRSGHRTDHPNSKRNKEVKSEGRWFDPSWCHWNFSLT